jgi:hypothetical protein
MPDSGPGSGRDGAPAPGRIEPVLSEDDRIILGAEIELESARIDKIEAEVAKGQAALQGTVKKATAASEQYAKLLITSGKTEFTEEDFRQEEIDYYLQSAWWHASQVFGVNDPRNKWKRPQGVPENAAEEEAMRREERKYRRIEVKHEVIMYFQGLGINSHEIEAELKELLTQRESFDMHNQTMSHGSNPQSFAGHFDSWVKRTADKYRSRTVAVVSAGGFDKLKRIAAIISPDQADRGGGGDAKELGRRGMTE